MEPIEIVDEMLHQCAARGRTEIQGIADLRLKNRPVTIKDVALASGCSWKTVSNVLNNRPGKAMDETRERVLKVMRDLNYQPNAIARGLASRCMNTIGLVLPSTQASLLSPYFSLVLGGVVDIAREERQNIMLFTGAVWMDSEQSLHNYRDGRCDGLLILSPPMGSDIVEALTEVELPFVVLGEKSHVAGVSSVYVDDVQASQNATEYLLEMGHRRIAVLSAGPEEPYVMNRIQGYRRALAARGVPFDGTIVQFAEHNSPSVGAWVNLWMGLPENQRPTAVFCTHDELALLTLPALSSRGITVPGEMSVMGFDDVVAASTTHPMLTTVHQPLHEMGRRAVEILLRNIRDEDFHAESIAYPTNVVIRESVARLTPDSGH